MAGDYCSGTACVVKKGTGAACTANDQCASGSCMTGACTPTSCTVDADCIGGAFCWLGACTGLTAVSAGLGYTCALTTGGGVQCWGYNGQGELGNNSTTDSHVPVAVSGLASGVAAISSGPSDTCALTTGGGLECWGYNATGQLGNNSTTDSHVPVAVSGLSSGIAAVSASTDHTCALTTGGAALCWGENVNGQIGDGSTMERLAPFPVSGLSSGVAAVTAGWFYTCAVTTAGGALCWGYNADGQLGNGTYMDRHVPVAVSGLSSGVAAIAAGQNHACALTTAGGVLCWGSNLEGQLGDGSTVGSATPVAVTGLSSGVTRISAGEYHTCALTAGGVAQCWGYNGDGELGDHSKTQSDVPVDVALSPGVSAIACGAAHTCALTGGRVQCWGDDTWGGLGDNATTQSDVPVAVVEP